MARLAWVKMGGCDDDAFVAHGPWLKSFEASVLAHAYDMTWRHPHPWLPSRTAKINMTKAHAIEPHPI